MQSKQQTPEINIREVIKQLAVQRRSLGLLKISYRDDRSHEKWENMTENIVIACFGLKSNQINQFHDLAIRFYKKRDHELLFSNKMGAKEYKDKMKDLLTVFISELETRSNFINGQEQPKENQGSGIRISVKQNVTQNTNIDISISSIIDNIRLNEPNPERVKEAENVLGQMHEELKKEKPEWSGVKKALSWLLDFSRDAFLQALPIILDKYTK